jgi:hypothetical protein
VQGARSTTLQFSPITRCVGELAAHWTFPRGTVGAFSRRYQFINPETPIDHSPLP